MGSTRISHRISGVPDADIQDIGPGCAASQVDTVRGPHNQLAGVGVVADDRQGPVDLFQKSCACKIVTERESRKRYLEVRPLPERSRHPSRPTDYEDEISPAVAHAIRNESGELVRGLQTSGVIEGDDVIGPFQPGQYPVTVIGDASGVVLRSDFPELDYIESSEQPSDALRVIVEDAGQIPVSGLSGPDDAQLHGAFGRRSSVFAGALCWHRIVLIRAGSRLLRGTTRLFPALRSQPASPGATIARDRRTRAYRV